MTGYSYVQAAARAFKMGATEADIEAEAQRQARHVGTVPFNNMVRALNLHPWHNDRDQWTRLAGALLARRSTRRRAA